MQPLINLKQFLAVLLLLIIPTALLVAYFRNYDPKAAGHHHDSQSTRHGTGEMTTETIENHTSSEQKASRIEALRKQVEASRIQFESNRKALEALTSGDQTEKQVEPAGQPQNTVPMEKERSSSHDHMHHH